MSSQRRSGLTSAFDDMLEANRKRFDDLHDGAPSPAAAAPPPTPPAPRAAPTAGFGVPSDAVRFLNDRYGHGWRHDVGERRREGDEVIVLCTLRIEETGTTKSQFGRARVGAPAGGQAITGSAGGVSFSLGATNGPAAGTDPEEAAYKRAVEAALAKCAAML